MAASAPTGRRSARCAGRAGRRPSRSTSPPAACCTTARASGTPASRCPAGRSALMAGRRRAALARPALLADPWAPGDGDRPTPRRWPRALAAELRPRPSDAVLPAYEDVLHAPVAAGPPARRRPAASTSTRPTLDRAVRRASRPIARLDAGRAASPTGWVLPLHRRRRPRWVSATVAHSARHGSAPDPGRLADGPAPAPRRASPGSRPTGRARRSSPFADDPLPPAGRHEARPGGRPTLAARTPPPHRARACEERDGHLSACSCRR